ncbi:hypothetical protein EDC56_0616 [Sinobacterium caligoides]|uniref:Uncharacterized protein n=1 Tax=Sinobacterium caligoides TaxID=933926 RepID=A0A3N2DZL8_9GAMM|nr:hypothetical protein [Sinobacterium caligoides]ROS05092.1 hypothetical protein EDC56_0616 [Sinobacterium caligoides]
MKYSLLFALLLSCSVDAAQFFPTPLVDEGLQGDTLHALECSLLYQMEHDDQPSGSAAHQSLLLLKRDGLFDEQKIASLLQFEMGKLNALIEATIANHFPEKRGDEATSLAIKSQMSRMACTYSEQ